MHAPPTERVKKPHAVEPRLFGCARIIDEALAGNALGISGGEANSEAHDVSVRPIDCLECTEAVPQFAISMARTNKPSFGRCPADAGLLAPAEP